MHDDLPTFGPWRAVEELGRGGMGVVWRCAHVATGELVAVKTLHGVDDPEGLAREVFALARLDDPQLPRIVDQQLDGDPAWYAMASIRGTPLSERLASQGGSSSETLDLDALPDEAAEPADEPGLPLQECLDLLAALCRPLAVLHGEGLVHRDLKPENVVVRPDGVPVLIDLGLATLVLGRDAIGQAVSTGTPAYMAPEQIRKDPVDARTDLYALGCLAFELLTGQPPFVGTAPALLTAHLTRPAPLVIELRPDVPRELAMLIDRLLAKDREQRPGLALDVEGALRRLGARVPETGGRRPRPYVYRASLVGRQDTRARLIALLDGSEPQPVALTGPSGRGKTRLLSALLAEARARALPAIAVGCAAVGALASDEAPLRSLLRQLARLAGGRSQSWWGPWGPVLAQLEPSLRRLPGLSVEPRPAPLPAGPDRERQALALLETLEAAAADHGLLLVADDLQWSGPTLLRLLTRAATRPGRLRLVTAWRSDSDRPELAALAEHLDGLSLDVLGPADVAAIAGQVLAGTPPAEVLPWVVARAAGNPLGVTEGLAALVQSGTLAHTSTGWSLRGELPRVDSLDEVLALRLRDLEPETREVVAHLALQGKRVWPRWSGLPREQTDAGVQELRALGVLDVVDGQLQFAHDAVRDAALHTVPPHERPRVHARLAEALDRSEARSSHLEALAHHLERSGQRAAAAAAWEDASRAARTESARLRLREAALDAATEPTLDLLEKRLELLMALTDAEAGRAEAQLSAILRDAAAIGGPDAEIAATQGRIRLQLIRGSPHEAEPEIRALLARMPLDHPARRRVRRHLVFALMRTRRPAEALEEALRLADEGTRQERFETWATIAFLYNQVGADRALVEDALRRHEALARSPYERAHAADVRMSGLPPEHPTTRAERDELRQAVRVLEEHGMLREAAVGLQHLGRLAAYVAAWEESLETLRAALRATERIEDPLLECFVWYYIGRVTLISGGSLDDAERAAYRVIELAERVGAAQDAADGYLDLGHIALTRGQDARPWRERALAALGVAHRDRHLHAALDNLEAAIAAADAGRPLVCGHSPERLTPAQLRDAVARGLLPPDALSSPPPSDSDSDPTP